MTLTFVWGFIIYIFSVQFHSYICFIYLFLKHKYSPSLKFNMLMFVHHFSLLLCFNHVIVIFFLFRPDYLGYFAGKDQWKNVN